MIESRRFKIWGATWAAILAASAAWAPEITTSLCGLMLVDAILLRPRQ